MKSTFGSASDQKKIPENKKYAHVQSSLDTGATSKGRPSAPTAGEIAKRRDEIFKRIKPSTLARLVAENEVCESVYALGSDAGDRGSASSVVASKAGPSSVAATGAAAAASVASVGSVAGSVVSVITSDTTLAESRDLVLLDLREPEEYQKCHLPMADSYPSPKINRDQFSPELIRCKRDPSKLLVVYHNNDATTAQFATLLVQKGWDSVYALSGGFEEVVQSYPEVLEGEIPSRPDTGGTARTSSSRRP